MRSNLKLTLVLLYSAFILSLTLAHKTKSLADTLEVIKSKIIFQQNFTLDDALDIWNSLPMTERETHQHSFKKIRNEGILYEYQRTHERMMTRRESNPKLNSPRQVIVQNSKGKWLRGVTSTQDGAMGISLGIIYGMQFSKSVESQCYLSLQSYVYVWEEVLSYLVAAYLPANWADLMKAYQDSLSIVSGIYANCHFEQLLTTVGAIFSQEGFSTFVIRIFSGVIWDLQGTFSTYANASTTFIRGEAIGEMVAILFNFRI
eukprot:403371802